MYFRHLRSTFVLVSILLIPFSGAVAQGHSIQGAKSIRELNQKDQKVLIDLDIPVLETSVDPAAEKLLDHTTELVKQVWEIKDGNAPIRVVLIDSLRPESYFVTGGSGERILAISPGALKLYDNDTQVKWLIGQHFEEKSSEFAEFAAKRKPHEINKVERLLQWSEKRTAQKEGDIKSTIERIQRKGEDPREALRALEKQKAYFSKGGVSGALYDSRITATEGAIFALEKSGAEKLNQKVSGSISQDTANELIASSAWKQHQESSVAKLLSQAPPELEQVAQDLTHGSESEYLASKYYQNALKHQKLQLNRLIEFDQLPVKEQLKYEAQATRNTYEHTLEVLNQRILPQIETRNLQKLSELQELAYTHGFRTGVQPEWISIQKRLSELSKKREYLHRKRLEAEGDSFKLASLETEETALQSERRSLLMRADLLSDRFSHVEDFEDHLDDIRSNSTFEGFNSVLHEGAENKFFKLQHAEAEVGPIRKRIELAASRRIEQSLEMIMGQKKLRLEDCLSFGKILGRLPTEAYETTAPRALRFLTENVTRELAQATTEKAKSDILTKRNVAINSLRPFDSTPYDLLPPKKKAIADAIVESQLAAIPYLDTSNLSFYNSNGTPIGFQAPKSMEQSIFIAEFDGLQKELKRKQISHSLSSVGYALENFERKEGSDFLQRMPLVKKRIQSYLNKVEESFYQKLKLTGVANPRENAKVLTSLNFRKYQAHFPTLQSDEELSKQVLATFQAISKRSAAKKEFASSLKIGTLLDLLEPTPAVTQAFLDGRELISFNPDSFKIVNSTQAEKRVKQILSIVEQSIQKGAGSYQFGFELLDPREWRVKVPRFDHLDRADWYRIQEKYWNDAWDAQVKGLFSWKSLPPDFHSFLLSKYGYENGPKMPDALIRYLENLNPNQKIELANRMLKDLPLKPRKPYMPEKDATEEIIQKFFRPWDVPYLADNPKNYDAVSKMVIARLSLPYEAGKEITKAEETFVTVFHQLKGHPEFAKRFTDPDLVSKVASENTKFELAKFQLRERFKIRSEKSQNLPLVKRSEVRPEIEEMKALIQKQFPKPSSARDYLLEDIERELRTTEAENHIFNELRLKKSWAQLPELVALDAPALVTNLTPTLHEKFSFLNYLIDPKKDEILQGLSAAGKQNFVSIRTKFAEAPVEARNYFLQPFLRPLLENETFHPEIIEMTLGELKGDQMVREIFETYLKAAVKVSGDSGRQFVLGHILASYANSKVLNKSSVVEILNAMGPFGLRLGQEIHSHGLASPEILDQIEHLYDSALKPSRMTQISDLKALFGKNFDRVVVGDLVGSGSINYVMEVGFLDEHGNLVERRAVRIQRSTAENQVSHQNEIWEVMNDDLARSENSETRKMGQVFEELRLSNMHTLSAGGKELDPGYERKIYKNVVNSYENAVPHPKTGFTVEVAKPIDDVADWIDPHSSVKGEVYEFARGESILKLPEGALKKNVAGQIIESELSAAFQKFAFDPDGHPGNWLVDSEGGILTRADYSQFLKIDPSEAYAVRNMLYATSAKELGAFEKKQILSKFARIYEMNQKIPAKVLNQAIEKVLNSSAFTELKDPVRRILGLRLEVEKTLEAQGYVQLKVRIRDNPRALLKSVGKLKKYREILNDENEFFEIMKRILGADSETQLHYAWGKVKEKSAKFVKKVAEGCKFSSYLKAIAK